jgi:hypothetical protein
MIAKKILFVFTYLSKTYLLYRLKVYTAFDATNDGGDDDNDDGVDDD